MASSKITEDEAKSRIKLRAKAGRPKKGEENLRKLTKISTDTTEYVTERLRRDDPALAARVERRELTANAAAAMKGWRKPRPSLSRFDQIVRWLPSLTDRQRQQLKEML